MTEGEAIRELDEMKNDLYALGYFENPEKESETFDMAIAALKEIQNYRRLGKLEELARAKKYIDLAKKHGTIGEMIDSCAEYEEIGTAEECRAAVEKQKPKKPRLNYKPKFFGKATYTCPKCGNICLEKFANERQNNNYCWDCGQALNWNENLEGMEDK
ncbi:MAG TPA: hypothetical protein IAB44_11935 [Candidatus Limivivens intestinipullorum]|uniref:Uncharacterized protein n=1 Tax=Candidatus Limivivens intestinipullorum TaxID=2840858 RepID=A0A9D1EUJ9_9FIRM|nr:hypothetical protein [Candidatus Limivivens intestinipullorum]